MTQELLSSRSITTPVRTTNKVIWGIVGMAEFLAVSQMRLETIQCCK